MPVYAALNSFNAGELSPKMLGRVDVSQYSKGCRKLENFLVTPYGAAERRPGTRYIAEAKDPEHVRLIRFVYSSTISYVLEFGPLYIRFFKDGAPVMNGSSPLELVTPYTAQELADLQVVQSADVMTIVHPNHPVKELKRMSATGFTLADKVFEYPPMLDPNLEEDHTITPSAVDGEGITLTASHDTFAAGNVGGYFQLIHTRSENKIEIDFEADGTTGTLEVKGYWTFTTHGTWSGTVTIQRSYDYGTLGANATWQDLRTYSSAADSNVSTDGEEEDDDVYYRLKMDGYAASTTGTLNLCRCLFVNPDFVTTGVVKITAVTSARSATGNVIRKLGGTDETHEWNEGAWSDRRGFPRAVTFFEERMVFAGTAARPQTVWASKTGDWDNFLLSGKDDAALEFTLASDTVNDIRWLCQHDALVIGAADSEWTLSASSADAPLTPTNFKVRRQSVYGSGSIPALMAGEVILFIQRGGRKVREFVYSWEKDGYTSPDLTILADHITGSGIVETALQQLPDTVLWCVLADGTAAALTYEREQQVTGWHRHVTDGTIKSVCVVPAGAEDKVYFAVLRQGRIFIEVLAGRGDMWYVDAGLRKTAAENFSTVEGLAHLKGQTVAVLADGAAETRKTVDANGKIVLDNPARSAVVGLPYTSVLSPMPIELELQNGHSLLRQKAIGELRIRVYDSVGGKVRAGADAWQKIISRDVLDDDLDRAVAAKSEVVVLNMLSGNETATTIEIAQDEPLPLNVTSLVATYEVMEK